MGSRALVVATITIVAALVADGVTTIVGGWIAADAIVGPSTASTTETETRDVEAIACAILSHGVFDSTVGAIDCEGTDGPGDEPTPETPPTEQPCDPGLRLVATYVERGGDRIAMIRDASGSTLLYVVGHALGEHAITAVDPERVTLARGETTCTLALFEGERPATPTLVATAPASSAPRGPLAHGDRVSVPADAIHRAIADPSSMTRSLRAVPVPEGLRLSGIRPDHPLAALGVQSGDVIRSVDGVAMDGPDAWLGVLGSVQRGGAHAVEIGRGGRTIAITVDVTR